MFTNFSKPTKLYFLTAYPGAINAEDCRRYSVADVLQKEKKINNLAPLIIKIVNPSAGGEGLPLQE